MKKKIALVILDGWWMTTDSERSATAKAHTPFVDSLYEKAAFCTLEASEEAVGLPKWQVGNSEVGHGTLGSGRVNYQNLVRINKAIEDKTFFDNQKLLDAIDYAELNNKTIHLMGLVSDGGVHSHTHHLQALISLLEEKDSQYCMHLFTDGRDTDPNSALGFTKTIKESSEFDHISSIIWRYYAMDRDNRWERIQQAYNLLVHWEASDYYDFWEELGAIQDSYDDGITDEFIKATKFGGKYYGTIWEWDVVIFFNFRSDRARELVSVLTQSDYLEHNMEKVEDLRFLCMTEYDANFKDLDILFPAISLANTLWEVLSKNHKTQLRIAETEKYPHVTFFFNGGIEEEYPGEERILIASPKVATYDLQPEMSAPEITEACMDYAREKQPDFICLNYANPDMVGHTGDFTATVKACETVDACTAKLCESLLQWDYQIIIIADHGNADYMKNDDGSANTAHSLALVPCFVLWNNINNLKLRDGSLADVAPTILDLMGITKPEEMSGTSLLM